MIPKGGVRGEVEHRACKACRIQCQGSDRSRERRKSRGNEVGGIVEELVCREVHGDGGEARIWS